MIRPRRAIDTALELAPIGDGRVSSADPRRYVRQALRFSAHGALLQIRLRCSGLPASRRSERRTTAITYWRKLSAVGGVLAITGIAACGSSTTSGSSSGGGPAAVKFIGGDGMVDGEFFTEAGAAGNGAYGTIAAPDPSKLESAKQFVTEYTAKYGTPGPYSANAYDAMGILLDAVRLAIVANGGQPFSSPAAFRESVRKQVASIAYDGAIGHTSFDSNGDTGNVLLTVKVGKDQTWQYQDTVKTTVGTPPPLATTTAAGVPTAAVGNLAGCQGTVTVASDLPTSGSDASDGVPTQQGAQLAIDQALTKKLLGGCNIKYLAKDDASVALGKHDPQQGALNLTELAGNQAVVGVVGPFNSNVAKVELPIANRANLTMISPSNTNPGLTIMGSNPDIDTASLRPTKVTTYFRVCTTDQGQGKALADYATSKLGAKNAYVFDDQETYGKGLADQFEKFFKQDGGNIASRVSLPGDTKDFKTQLTQAKGMNIDLIFFGGTSSNGGGILRKQMIQQGIGSSQ